MNAIVRFDARRCPRWTNLEKPYGGRGALLQRHLEAASLDPENRVVGLVRLRVIASGPGDYDWNRWAVGPTRVPGITTGIRPLVTPGGCSTGWMNRSNKMPLKAPRRLLREHASITLPSATT